MRDHYKLTIIWNCIYFRPYHPHQLSSPPTGVFSVPESNSWADSTVLQSPDNLNIRCGRYVIGCIAKCTTLTCKCFLCMKDSFSLLNWPLASLFLLSMHSECEVDEYWDLYREYNASGDGGYAFYWYTMLPWRTRLKHVLHNPLNYIWRVKFNNTFSPHHIFISPHFLCQSTPAISRSEVFWLFFCFFAVECIITSG